jgi:hypothetical protein
MSCLRGDPLYNEYELHRLYQRYALAVLYYSTNGQSWDYQDGWRSFFYVDICGYSSRLRVLDLFVNGLDGSLPTEWLVAHRIGVAHRLGNIQFQRCFLVRDDPFRIVRISNVVPCCSLNFPHLVGFCSGKLTSLKRLSITGTSMRGTIPTEL